MAVNRGRMFQGNLGSCSQEEGSGCEWLTIDVYRSEIVLLHSALDRLLILLWTGDVSGMNSSLSLYWTIWVEYARHATRYCVYNHEWGNPWPGEIFSLWKRQMNRQIVKACCNKCCYQNVCGYRGVNKSEGLSGRGLKGERASQERWVLS